MTLPLFFLVVASVLLTSIAQLLLKAGMREVPVQTAISSGSIVEVVLAVAFSPPVFGGLAMFGLSVVLWLAVLAKVQVSQAYPMIALGIVITSAGGFFIFGETMNAVRLCGIAAIITGVLLVANS
ncbi:EamA family transporter [Croceicoccus hydrothermalis]|uniref:EamA family transporter n=1 Tax=Croceicoccus hydrothermalis TaxID=2867964 RepID=UPI001EFC13B9|nr:EamA family transporter [Croceicoccus hydrothermalis]